MDQPPLITVLMSVHDADPALLRQAVDSILGQDRRDFEFLVVDDGNPPEVLAMLEETARADQRVRLLRNEANQGLAASLNRGLREARGRYVARQDADDVSLPGRLARQAEILAADPAVAVVGSDCVDVEDDGSERRWGSLDRDALQSMVYRRNPLPHSSVMFRRDAVDEAGGYDESYDTSQDFELWMRLAERGHALAMVREPLLRRRVGAGTMTAGKKWRQCRNSMRARLAHPGLGLATALRESLRQYCVTFLPRRLALALRDWRRG